MLELIPRPDPLGLPVPAPLLLGLKVLGFLLHMVFMNLWVAGLPTALVLLKAKPKVATRLFKSMPFFMAFGINAGIVPLLFIQTLYPQFFYPATILQAWFWFLVIPLLLIAYYGVYLAAFGRLRIISALVASLLLTWIGLNFSAALSLTAAPEKWPSIFLSGADAGSIYGTYFHLEQETILRYLMVLGMGFGTVSAFLALDSELSSRDQNYKNDVWSLVPLIYGLGLAVYGIAGSLYSPTVVEKLPPFLWLLPGLSMPVGMLLAIAYWKRPGKWTAGALAFAQLAVLVSNAIMRQIVQSNELKSWVDLGKIPVRGEWGSFFLFAFTLLFVFGVLIWIALTALRSARNAA